MAPTAQLVSYINCRTIATSISMSAGPLMETNFVKNGNAQTSSHAISLGLIGKRVTKKAPGTCKQCRIVARLSTCYTNNMYVSTVDYGTIPSS